MPCGANERYEHSDVAQDPEDLAPAYVAAEFHEEYDVYGFAKEQAPREETEARSSESAGEEESPVEGQGWREAQEAAQEGMIYGSLWMV